MDRRHAFARFATPTPSTAAQYRRPHQRQGVRVGKVGEVYLDPAAYQAMYHSTYDAAPGIWALLAVVISLGQQLTELVNVANEVEAVGGGSKQLKLELARRREDWDLIFQLIRSIIMGESDDPDADFARAYADVFDGMPQDQGKFQYEDGGEQYPPRYGLAWEIGSLYNQTWAMWSPMSWINASGDEPWYSWIPEAIAAGWVAVFNDVQAVANESPGEGPGWGAEIGQAAEATEKHVVDLGNQGKKLLEKAMNIGAGVGVLALILGGAVLFGGRR